MPILKQHRYYRSDLQSNPNVLYVFGDNEQAKGKKGQAAEARGEPNAFGIPTKRAPFSSDEAFWTDDELDRQTGILDNRFAELEAELAAGRIVVWPSDGIGTGLSKLPERAPRTQAVIDRWIDTLFKRYGA